MFLIDIPFKGCQGRSFTIHYIKYRYLLFTAFSIPGPVVVFGRKQDLSEFPSGLAALIPCYQTAS
jgi:hypothetical protein